MKYILIFFILLANLSFGQELAEITNITIHSEKLNQERKILVYTPRGYNENAAEQYDVIYVFDAQSRELFDYTHAVLSFINSSDTNFIVVGIPSLYNEKADYTRNDDLLPALIYEETKERFGKHYGNADNLMLFIKDELKPYLVNKYRVTGNSVAVGHSNSASFIIYSMTKFPELFDDYIAISPNFSNDREELAKNFQKIDFEKFSKNKFLYLSNATEEESKGWESWKPARDNVYAFLNKNKEKLPKLAFTIQAFPQENHWSTFAPGVTNGLKAFFNFKYAQKHKLSEALYEITITVKVPNKNDEVFITGNQAELGNWQPEKIKLQKKSALVRQIKLKVHTPALFKFTRGSWETEGMVKDMPEGENIRVEADATTAQNFEITNWKDKE
jgi:uncharacterized protein